MSRKCPIPKMSYFWFNIFSPFISTISIYTPDLCHFKHKIHFVSTSMQKGMNDRSSIIITVICFFCLNLSIISQQLPVRVMTRKHIVKSYIMPTFLEWNCIVIRLFDGDYYAAESIILKIKWIIVTSCYDVTVDWIY